MGDMVEDGGDHRQQCRAEAMLPNHRPLGQTLGPGGADVVLSQHFPAGAGGLAHQVAQAAQADHRGREHQVAQQVPRPPPPAAEYIPAAGSQPRTTEKKKIASTHKKKPGALKLSRVSPAGQPAPEGAGLPGGHHPQGNADHHRGRHSRPRKDQGGAHPLGDHAQDRLTCTVGQAQVPGEQLLQPQHVADGKGLVQTKIRLQRGPAAALEASSPPARSAMVAGAIFMRKKTRRVMPKNTGSAPRTRFTRYCAKIASSYTSGPNGTGPQKGLTEVKFECGRCRLPFFGAPRRGTAGPGRRWDGRAWIRRASWWGPP